LNTSNQNIDVDHFHRIFNETRSSFNTAAACFALLLYAFLSSAGHTFAQLPQAAHLFSSALSCCRSRSVLLWHLEHLKQSSMLAASIGHLLTHAPHSIQPSPVLHCRFPSFLLLRDIRVHVFSAYMLIFV
jgi:hypothetical protein